MVVRLGDSLCMVDREPYILSSMYARITRARARNTPVPPAALDAVPELMASIAQMAGHLGAVWLLNRSNGDAVAIDFYGAAMDLANTSQGDLRDAVAEALDVEVTGVAEYEVVGLDRVRHG